MSAWLRRIERQASRTAHDTGLTMNQEREPFVDALLHAGDDQACLKYACPTGGLKAEARTRRPDVAHECVYASVAVLLGSGQSCSLPTILLCQFSVLVTAEGGRTEHRTMKSSSDWLLSSSA